VVKTAYTHPLDDIIRTQMSKPSSAASEFMSEVLPLNEAFSTCLPCLDTVVMYLLGTPCNRYPRLKGIPFRKYDNYMTMNICILTCIVLLEFTPFSVPVNPINHFIKKTPSKRRTILQSVENLGNLLRASLLRPVPKLLSSWGVSAVCRSISMIHVVFGNQDEPCQ